MLLIWSRPSRQGAREAEEEEAEGGIRAEVDGEEARATGATRVKLKREKRKATRKATRKREAFNKAT